MNEKNIQNLDKTQRNVCTDFFMEFQDVFSEKIVAGNWWSDVVQHEINLIDSRPIKQTPRQFLFQFTWGKK